MPPGARFCTQCGEPVGAGGAGPSSGSRAAWILAAAAAVVVLLVLFLPRQADRVPAPRAGGAEMPLTAPAGGGLGPLTGDMRSNADRLFNRIMVAAEQGDRAEVEQFMPMAIQAYGMVDDLDDDGLYHLGILHLTAGEPEEARAVADRILEDSPSHLLALAVAASAEEEMGNTAAARSLWERLLAAYDEEAGKPRPEYLDHQAMLTEYQRMAREATGRD